jgi:hypothetical protein
VLVLSHCSTLFRWPVSKVQLLVILLDCWCATSSSSLAEHPFLRHGFPYWVTPYLSWIRLSLFIPLDFSSANSYIEIPSILRATTKLKKFVCVYTSPMTQLYPYVL